MYSLSSLETEVWMYFFWIKRYLVTRLWSCIVGFGFRYMFFLNGIGVGERGM